MGTRFYYRSLPRRFRRSTLLIVGCGDVGTRLAGQLMRRHAQDRLRIVGVVRSDESARGLRDAGIVPVVADLADRRALARVRGLSSWMAMFAPPPNAGPDDPHSRRLIAALSHPAWRRAAVAGMPTGTNQARGTGSFALTTTASPAAMASRRWVYLSTTGVYGDTGGARFDESRPPAPASARAIRRVDAERSFRAAARRGTARAPIVRAPGIYGQDRLPLERLRKGLPAILANEDVYTNHIHADDLAWICWLALFRGRATRVYHAVDDSDLKMGDYFDMVADATGLPRPPRVGRAELPSLVSPMMLSFMSESRRLLNRRLHDELRCRLQYPDVAATLAALERS